MSVARFVLPVLAAAGVATAATCSTSGTYTIQNSGDASAIGGCATYSGSIAIATGTTGSVDFGSIQKIDGSLTATNVSQLDTISGSSLTEITEELLLSDVQILANLNLPSLTTVDTLTLLGLPNLQSLTANIQRASKVDIENTQLSSIEGIDLKVVDEIVLANNGLLQNLTLNLGNITTRLEFSANGDQLVADFPNLIWAYNMTFRNLSDIKLPKLTSVNGSLGFYSTQYESFEISNLTKIGGDVIFSDNPNLADISLPELATVSGGFKIAQNPSLMSIGFPSLKTVGGALDFSGNFTNVTLEDLNDVKGAFNLQSTADISADCSHFSGIHGANKPIKGKFNCAGKQVTPGDAQSTPTGSGASATKSGAAGHLEVSSSAMMGFTGVLAAIFGLL